MFVRKSMDPTIPGVLPRPFSPLRPGYTWSASPTLPRKEDEMYIGIGTLLVIILLVILLT